MSEDFDHNQVKVIWEEILQHGVQKLQLCQLLFCNNTNSQHVMVLSNILHVTSCAFILQRKTFNQTEKILDYIPQALAN